MKLKNKKPSEAVLLSEIELLLSEKRTYYSVLRTGIAVITVPLTVLIFLLATKEYHKLFDNKLTAVIINLILVAIVTTGIVMVILAAKRLKKINKVEQSIEKEDKRVDKIVV